MFRTAISLKPVKRPISHNSNILSMGSCFADFIGGQLERNKFKIVTNPLGIIFHPLAQFKILMLALNNKLPPDQSYLFNQDIWCNYLFHSSINHTSRSGLENLIKERVTGIREQLTKVDFILLTFGTAIQYRHISSDLLVANCHKVPGKHFERSISTPKAIVNSFQKLYSALATLGPRIIISVSPIRHLKEGIENNCESKSVLRVACAQIVKQHPEVTYFPGFEIMMDDLRDYRFFEKDMIHPNGTARDYIWELFRSNYLDQQAQGFVEKWSKIMQNIAHKPFHPQTPGHQEFIRKTLALIRELPPEIDTTREVEQLKRNLI